MLLLPAELIDRILSFLRGDIPALKSCSNTHPFFSQLAERYLYANLIVKTDDHVLELHNQLSKNPYILDYPRSLEIHIYDTAARSPVSMQETHSTMLMVPRMTNLMSLKICGPPISSLLCPGLTFHNCLRQLSVEQVCLCDFYDFPLSVLDNGKNTKKLTLSDCIARREPISNSPHPSLETLIIRGDHNQALLLWAMGRVANLTSLQLRDLIRDHEWTGFPELLTACSSSLKRLHLDIIHHGHSSYFYSIYGHDDVGHWIYDSLEFPFALSPHLCLKQLSISAEVRISQSHGTIHCALPAIMRLIKTAPAIRDVFLRFQWICTNIRSLGKMDWTPLVLHQSDFPGGCPRIHLCISGDLWGYPVSHETILGTLAENEALMGLVKRDVVTLIPVEEWTDIS